MDNQSIVIRKFFHRIKAYDNDIGAISIEVHATVRKQILLLEETYALSSQITCDAILLKNVVYKLDLVLNPSLVIHSLYLRVNLLIGVILFKNI
jgi:hypothetical protein